ncbi:MAG: serine/threonine protein kinase, partial [Myxococcales bacterium]
MGVVYEAIDQRTQARVALKLLASAISEDMPDVVARFEREVTAASSIDSDHIVRVFDAGSEDGSPFMVMELVHGRDLHQWCKQLRQMRPETVVRLAGQACEGLAKAHAAGVVHRDIKPGNIFLSERGDEVDAKILDFGIAKLKMDQVQGDPGLTKTGNMLGSPHYMSPEQAQGLRTIDHRTDIWSLGVVMYKALTGRTPFADLDSMGQVIIAIWSMPIPPVQDGAPWVSPELAAVVHKALQKKADDRYQ